jgi:hypothetical protein
VGEPEQICRLDQGRLKLPCLFPSFKRRWSLGLRKALRFPNVVDALVSLDGDFVLDGELVALDSQGRPSFQLLQNILPSRFRFIFTSSIY